MNSKLRRTECGQLPDGWDVKSLDVLTERVTNGFVGRAKDYYDESGDGVLYIQGYNVKPNLFDLHGIKRVTPEFHDKHRKSCLKAGDLLTVQTGDCGVTAVVPESLEGSNCHALVISRLNQDIALPSYYGHYFNSERGMNAFQNIETGTTMKHLNIGDMKPLMFPIPPKKEQRAIAEALTDVDALINALDALINKKRHIKQGTMQQLLTSKKRLPGFSDEWETKKLETVGRFKKGRSIPKKHVASSGVPCVLYGEIYTRYENVASHLESFLPPELASRSESIQTGDILFAGSGETAEEIGKCFAYIGEEKAYAGGDLIILTPHEDNSEFLGYLLNSPPVMAQKAKLGQGSSVVHIYTSGLMTVEVKLPSSEEQTAIASVLSDMDREIEALEQKRDKTRLIKQGMMQELLTGKTRLI